MKKLLVIALVVLFAGAANAELVNNPEPWTANSAQSGWSRWGGGQFTWGWASGSWMIDNAWNSTGGNPGAYVALNMLSPLNSATTATMPLTAGFNVEIAHGNFAYAGVLYTLSADIKNLNAGSHDTRLKFEFYRVGGAISSTLGVGWDWHPTFQTGTTSIIVPVTTSWANYSITMLAPPNTVKVSVILVINASASGDASGFDNVLLVPEPATIALLSLGGLFLRRRK